MFLWLRFVVVLMLMCVLSLCCGGVAADVRYDFALLPLYGVRLVTDISTKPWHLSIGSDSAGKRVTNVLLD